MSLKRIKRELFLYSKELEEEKNLGKDIIFTSCEEDNFLWNVKVRGLDGGVYGSFYFNLEIRFPSDYPFKPFKIEIKTKMYHPSVSHPYNKRLNHCVCCLLGSMLRNEWTPRRTVLSCMRTFRKMVLCKSEDIRCGDSLENCFQNEEANELLVKKNYDKYRKLALHFCRKYAIPVNKYGAFRNKLLNCEKLKDVQIYCY